MSLDTREIERSGREADKIDRRRAALFAPMIRSEAWQEYVKLLEAKLQAYSDQLLTPAGSQDGMVYSEWVKGAMSGLIMARDIASATITAAQDIRRAAHNEEDDDDAA